MVLTPHATASDLIGTPGHPGVLSAADAAIVAGWSSAEVDRVLARASELVDEATGRAVYMVDAAGLAVDPIIAAALRSATCLVVEQWIEVGEANDVDGRAGEQVSVTGFAGRRAPDISDRALRVLRLAGLLAQPEVR